eukprot:10531653-Heterocapsa_arctica.AAC.1
MQRAAPSSRGRPRMKRDLGHASVAPATLRNYTAAVAEFDRWATLTHRRLSTADLADRHMK